MKIFINIQMNKGTYLEPISNKCDFANKSSGFCLGVWGALKEKLPGC